MPVTLLFGLGLFNDVIDACRAVVLFHESTRREEESLIDNIK